MPNDDPPRPRTPINAYETPLIPPPGRDLDAHIRFVIQFTPAERTRIFFSMMALHQLIGDALFAFLFDILISERYLETVNDPPKGRHVTPHRPRVLGRGRAAVSDLVAILPGLLYPNGKAPKRSTPLYSPTVLNILREVSRDPALFADALEQLARAIREPAAAPRKSRRGPIARLENSQATLERSFIRGRLKQARANPDGRLARNPHLRYGEALALGLDANETSAVLAYARLRHITAPLSTIDVDEAVRYFDTARKPPKGGTKRRLVPSTDAKSARKLHSSGAENANDAGRKRDRHDAHDHPHQARSPTPSTDLRPVLLPTRRPAAHLGDLHFRLAEHDRRREGPRRQAREGHPRPAGRGPPRDGGRVMRAAPRNGAAGPRATGNRPAKNSGVSSTKSTRPHRTSARPRQAHGQILRAEALRAQALRLALLGAWQEARALRTEAHRLRRLARPAGTREAA